MSPLILTLLFIMISGYYGISGLSIHCQKSRPDQIYAQSVQTQIMPLANRSGMTVEERQFPGQWYQQLEKEGK